MNKWDLINRNIILGKSIHRNGKHNSSITYFEHYILIQINTMSTSNSDLHYFIPCNGIDCHLSSPYPFNHQFGCTVEDRTHNLYILTVYKKNYFPFNIPFTRPKKFYVPKKSFNSLRTSAFSLYTDL